VVELEFSDVLFDWIVGCAVSVVDALSWACALDESSGVDLLEVLS
jgi:hypothetical protein